MHSEPTTFSAESYFATQGPPPNLEHEVSAVRAFVAQQTEQNRNVVLVTVRSFERLFDCFAQYYKHRVEELLFP